MSNPYLKRVALAGGGIALSAMLTLLEERLANMHTPGTYVAGRLFNGPNTNIALAGLVWIGVDFLLWFAVLSGAHSLFAKFCK
jgi:hypothetical protein